MKRIFWLAPLLLVAACFDRGPVGNRHVPEPAKPVAIKRYTGLWYEMARYDNGFEKNCKAVTAEYKALPDGKISVVNNCHKKTIDGKLDVAEGKAIVVEGSGNAKLKVSFFGPFYAGDYWVLDHADDYSWSIVGEESGRYLWVLTREAHVSANLKRELYDRVQKLGYDIYLLHDTPQP